MAFLRRLNADPDAAPIWLHRRITSIGSGDDATIRIDDADLAEHHATISCEGAEFVLRPAQRNTKTKLNTKVIRRKKPLAEGDTITVGNQSFSFHHLVDFDPKMADFFHEDRRRLEGLAKIHTQARHLLGIADFDELITGAVDASIALTGADKGFVLVVDDDQWRLHRGRNVDAKSLGNAPQQLSDSVVRQVMESQKPLLIADAGADPTFRSAQSVINLAVTSVLCLPLMARGQLQGILYLGNDQVTGLFDALHLELMSIFAAQLGLLIANARHVDELRDERQQLSQKLKTKRFGSLIGASDAMAPIFDAIERVATTDITVLITGETGTGKELVARELHRRSPRANGPFVVLNCGAIPGELLESELFGHVKGAFTGATTTKDGHFHAADGGTIFLDELGEMPLKLQVKLLRVLQERTFKRVGSHKPESVDIRILAATNRDLQARVDAGAFREDLYYRLNVIEVALPPLRERGDDVVLIANFLIDQIAQELGVEPKPLSDDARRALRHHRWPGNVRQLQNHLKKALVMAPGHQLKVKDLGLRESEAQPLKALAEAKEQFALDYILDVLDQNDGNRSQTARDLGVDPRTIFRYLEKAEESP